MWAWWAARASRAAETWFGPGQDALFAGFDTDLPLLEAILSVADRAPTAWRDQAGTQLLSRLWPLWTATNRIPYAARMLRVFSDRMDASATAANAALRFEAQWTLAWFALCVSDVAGTDEHLPRARRAAGPTPDPAQAAALTQIQGIRALYAGDPARARTHLAAALEHDQRVQNRPATFIDLSFLASAASLAGQREDAYDYAERAIALCESHGERWMKSQILWAFALSAWRDADRHRAYVIALDGLTFAGGIGDRYGAATCLEVVVWFEAADGDAVRAARLLGAAEGLWRSIGHPVRHWGTREHHEEAVRLLRRRLSASEFSDAFASGAAMDLQSTTSWISRTSSSSATEGALTPRQHEIVDLIAQGMTNKEISRVLLITVRTVEAHIGNVFQKLGLTSRTQIATWRTRR